MFHFLTIIMLVTHYSPSSVCFCSVLLFPICDVSLEYCNAWAVCCRLPGDSKRDPAAWCCAVDLFGMHLAGCLLNAWSISYYSSIGGRRTGGLERSLAMFLFFVIPAVSFTIIVMRKSATHDPKSCVLRPILATIVES